MHTLIQKRVLRIAVLALAGAACSLGADLLTTSFDASEYTLGNFYTSPNVVAQHQWVPYLTTGVPNAQIENTVVHSGNQAVSVNGAAFTASNDDTAVYHLLGYNDSGNEKALDAAIYMNEANFNTTWVPVAVRSFNNTFIASIAVSPAGATVTNGTAFSNRLAVQPGVWNYYRLHLDFTAQTATAYVNGVLVGSVPFPAALHDAGFVVIGAFEGNTGTPNVAYLDDLAVRSVPNVYYFPEIALGGGWQSTLTYVNITPEAVSCTTKFLASSGAALAVPFTQGAVSTRTDVLQPGQSLHDQSQANVSAPLVFGWAQATCTGAVQASMLYRLYQGTPPVAVSEVGVNATTSPATQFVTFAQTATGVAYANPSSTASAVVTFTVTSSTGTVLGSTTQTLAPSAVGIANIGPLLGLSSFTGSLEISSTVPIASFSINAEAFPVISALPPGQLGN
jgi:hypothetical protein